jgi:hypothetical protein
VCIYARDSRIPNANEWRDEIENLHRAAEARKFEKVAALLGELSQIARDSLTNRADRISRNNAGKRGRRRVSAIGRTGEILTRKPMAPRRVALPSPDDLRDESRREHACEAVATLSRNGGGNIEGRRRATGKRSKSWQWGLFAPTPTRNPKKRQAERSFVISIRLAWLESTGEPPNVAANASRPGPFVRMVQKCLALVGAGHADAVGIINWLNKQRAKENRRHLRSSIKSRTCSSTVRPKKASQRTFARNIVARTPCFPKILMRFCRAIKLLPR